MPKGKNQKFKLYRLAQIMLENTDEEHYITMPEIKEKLEEYEVTADPTSTPRRSKISASTSRSPASTR